MRTTATAEGCKDGARGRAGGESGGSSLGCTIDCSVCTHFASPVDGHPVRVGQRPGLAVGGPHTLWHSGDTAALELTTHAKQQGAAIQTQDTPHTRNIIQLDVRGNRRHARLGRER